MEAESSSTNAMLSPPAPHTSDGTASSHVPAYVPGSGPALARISLRLPQVPHPTAYIIDQLKLERRLPGSCSAGTTRPVVFYYLGWTDAHRKRGLVSHRDILKHVSRYELEEWEARLAERMAEDKRQRKTEEKDCEEAEAAIMAGPRPTRAQRRLMLRHIADLRS